MPVYEGNDDIWTSYKEKLEKEAELLVQPGRNPLLIMAEYFPDAVYELNSAADTSHFYAAKYDILLMNQFRRFILCRICEKELFCAVLCLHFCTRLSWPSRQLLTARKYTVLHHILDLCVFPHFLWLSRWILWK